MPHRVNANSGRKTPWMFMLFVLAAGVAAVSSMSAWDAVLGAEAYSATSPGPADLPEPARHGDANNPADANSPAEPEPIVWYGMMPHPYINDVSIGVEAGAKDNKIKVLKVIGREWTQDNEDLNIAGVSGSGHKAFSVYPADPAGANALFKRLKDAGRIVVCYGAEPDLPTPAAFTVATDIKRAAALAAEHLIKLMGDRGNILCILEVATDINTKKRHAGIREAVAKHPNVKITQTIPDMTQVSVAKEKIGAALAEGGGEIDGIITTAWNPTLAAAAVLTDWHKDPAHKRVRFIGLDTAPSVLKAIESGSIDATVAQNVFAHGYLTTAILKLMLDGWTPVKEYQFIDSGIVIVTKANVGTYERQLRELTAGIASNLKGTTKYLKPPAGTGPR